MRPVHDPSKVLSRRDFTLTALHFGLGAAGLAACAGGTDKFGSGGDDTGPAGDSGDSAETGDSADTSGPDGWASGGTASMSGDYPDPFDGETATSCALFCELTKGPCYAETMERKDISEGYPGLPMRLALRVVTEDCLPVAGATVDIWHNAASGLYSGEDAATMCTSGDEDAVSHRFFRGTQTTDGEGRVDFDSCLPGWYRGRAVHIHFTVRIGEDEYVTSQLAFDQELVDEITTTHPDYADRGAPDTTNSEDGILSSNLANFLVSTERMSDGALLAWKTIVIRSSLDEEPCSGTGGGV